MSSSLFLRLAATVDLVAVAVASHHQSSSAFSSICLRPPRVMVSFFSRTVFSICFFMLSLSVCGWELNARWCSVLRASQSLTLLSPRSPCGEWCDLVSVGFCLLLLTVRCSVYDNYFLGGKRRCGTGGMAAVFLRSRSVSCCCLFMELCE